MMIGNSSDLSQLICFKLENEYLGINILNVKAIINPECLIPVSTESEFLDGVLNFLEEIIPVINLKAMFNLPGQEPSGNSKILVISINEKTFGFIADDIIEVIRIPVILPVQSKKTGERNISRYVKATGKYKSRPLLLLDLEEIISEGALAF